MQSATRNAEPEPTALALRAGAEPKFSAVYVFDHMAGFCGDCYDRPQAQEVTGLVRHLE